MKKVLGVVVLSFFLLSANTLVTAQEPRNNFKFYVADNGSGKGIDAATVEVKGKGLCETVNGFCELVLKYDKNERVTITATANGYQKKTINTTLTSSETNLIGLDKLSRGRGRWPTASPFGLTLSNFFDVSFVSAQDSTGQEIQINFTVLVQDVAKARIPKAKVAVTDSAGTTKVLTTDKNGVCRFEKLKAGRIRISVTAPGFANGSAAPTVANGQQVAITLRIP